MGPDAHARNRHLEAACDDAVGLPLDLPILPVSTLAMKPVEPAKTGKAGS